MMPAYRYFTFECHKDALTKSKLMEEIQSSQMIKWCFMSNYITLDDGTQSYSGIMAMFDEHSEKAAYLKFPEELFDCAPLMREAKKVGIDIGKYQKELTAIKYTIYLIEEFGVGFDECISKYKIVPKFNVKKKDDITQQKITGFLRDIRYATERIDALNGNKLYEEITTSGSSSAKDTD